LKMLKLGMEFTLKNEISQQSIPIFVSSGDCLGYICKNLKQTRRFTISIYSGSDSASQGGPVQPSFIQHPAC